MVFGSGDAPRSRDFAAPFSTPCLGAVLHRYSPTTATREDFSSSTYSRAIWLGLVRSLSRRGFHRAAKRFIYVALAVPGGIVAT
jgi:hypothetical protein